MIKKTQFLSLDVKPLKKDCISFILCTLYVHFIPECIEETTTWFSGGLGNIWLIKKDMKNKRTEWNNTSGYVSKMKKNIARKIQNRGKNLIFLMYKSVQEIENSQITCRIFSYPLILHKNLVI